MKDFWLGLTKKQHAIVHWNKKEFMADIKGALGWGCVANITCYTGEVHVALLTPKEMKAFEKAWRTAKAVKK